MWTPYSLSVHHKNKLYFQCCMGQSAYRINNRNQVLQDDGCILIKNKNLFITKVVVYTSLGEQFHH